LHCILDVEKASRAASVDFALVPGPPQVQRIFEITKTADMLRFIEPIDDGEGQAETGAAPPPRR
jgi:hypothetical protein